MTTPTIFDICQPREDVLKGAIAEADFAADLAQVIVGIGSAEYLDPVRFFAAYLAYARPQEPARQRLSAFERFGR